MRHFSSSASPLIIKEMERPSEVIETIHGLFKIVTYESNTPLCYNCWYKHRKVSGAPCVDGKWCSGLYSSLLPLKIENDIPASEAKRTGSR